MSDDTTPLDEVYDGRTTSRTRLADVPADEPTSEQVEGFFQNPSHPVLPPACGAPHPDKEGVFCQKTDLPCTDYHLMNTYDPRLGSQPITWENPARRPKRESQPSLVTEIGKRTDAPKPAPGEDDWELPDGDRDGDTYEVTFDYERLNAQAKRVYDVIRGGAWWTLAGIAEVTGDPEASVSARLRDLRKAKFGGLNIERRSQERATGLFEYRLAQ